MLNLKRYHSIDSIFKSMNIQLADRDVILYADAFEILAAFLNNKLSDLEMVKVVDFLGDVITEKAPRVVVHVSKDERIKVQYPIMEKMTATKGKLTDQEKEMLAFCVYWMNCVQVYDEERDLVVSGLVDFTSVEKIAALYKTEKKNRPDFFAAENTKPVIDRTTYGLSLENPVRLTCIPDAYAYLNKLRHDNKPVDYSRLGSFSGKDGHLVDKYVLTVTQRKFLSKKISQTEIYIDCYSDVAIVVPPQGFTLD